MGFFNRVKSFFGKKGEEKKLELKTEIDVKPVIEENVIIKKGGIFEEKLAKEEKLGEELIEEKNLGKVGLIDEGKKIEVEEKKVERIEQLKKIEGKSLIKKGKKVEEKGLKEKAGLIEKKKKAEIGLVEKEKKPMKEKKQKAEKKLKIETESIVENIGGVDFIFCPESLKKFKEEFCESGWEIDYDINDLYIIRKKGNKMDYFHRWLKLEEIEDFIREKNCDEEGVIVHHSNLIRRDNRLTNLKVMGIGEYNSLSKKMSKYKE